MCIKNLLSSQAITVPEAYTALAATPAPESFLTLTAHQAPAALSVSDCLSVICKSLGNHYYKVIYLHFYLWERSPYGTIFTMNFDDFINKGRIGKSSLQQKMQICCLNCSGVGFKIHIFYHKSDCLSVICKSLVNHYYKVIYPHFYLWEGIPYGTVFTMNFDNFINKGRIGKSSLQ